MNHIEIDQIDVLYLPTEIADAHDVLLGLAPPSATAPPLVVPKPPAGLQSEL